MLIGFVTYRKAHHIFETYLYARPDEQAKGKTILDLCSLGNWDTCIKSCWTADILPSNQVEINYLKTFKFEFSKLVT